MQRTVRWRAGVAIFSIVVWGCTSGGEANPNATGDGTASGSNELVAVQGGTLWVGLGIFMTPQIERRNFLDPQNPNSIASGQREFLRCCLTRTLLSYTGRPTAEGGTVLHPDLATALPEVSDDALTWTFHLKEGIRYAPPLEDVEITTMDIVRALERTATPAIATEEYVSVFEPIEGLREFADGEASTISGLETPDPLTLRVHLTEVTNDLGYRFALPATAPIPPSPADPPARFGAAEGHDGTYGYYLISSGPYMIEGSEGLDPSLPTALQRPAPGLVEGESLTLVRNPSWSRDSDQLRKAYVDRIEFRVVQWRQGWRAVEQGSLDLMFDGAPPPQLLERYESDPELRDRLFREVCNFLQFASMRLTSPPFDDVHVRRAVNYALDEARTSELYSSVRWGSFGYVRFAPITHVAPDSAEAGLLAGWDPYPYDLAKAREEMALSRYDTDGDGLCDDPSCQQVLTLDTDFGPEPQVDVAWEEAFGAIGITLDIRRLPLGRLATRMTDPEDPALLTLVPWWEAEYPSPAPLFASAYDVAGIDAFPATNFSLIGASPDQLAAWGYRVRSVPSVSSKIDECIIRIGPAQQQCWAELDLLLMLQIVPAIPYAVAEEVRTVSDRVSRFSIDQPFAAVPALDQIALTGG
jgi:ABC-type transport system substrate-binding protein